MMKSKAMILLGVTTLLLVTVTLFVSMDFSFGWIFFLTCLGEALFVFTVYKVLRDDHRTDKTFADLYEDYPISIK